jgi:hypothetical protein
MLWCYSTSGVAHKFLLSASNPNSGIRARSIRNMLLRLEHIVLTWALIVLLLPFNSLIEVVRKPTLRVSRETSSTLDVRLAPCKSG